ncbi:MAG: hypothetical protein H6Q15_2084 [Bacteroidetes bacterium]|nr:hypothetical protein [Bacteroidota bacterium]
MNNHIYTEYFKVVNSQLFTFGSKLNAEPLKDISSPSDENISNIALNIINEANKSTRFCFEHPSHLDLNEVYHAIKEKSFSDITNNVSQCMYDTYGYNPKIKSDTLFFIAEIEDVLLYGEKVDAIAIAVVNKNAKMLCGDKLGLEQGYNICDIAEFALIVKQDEDGGYRVFSSENTMWKNDFLELAVLKDHSYQTNAWLSFLKSFINDYMPDAYEITDIQIGEMHEKVYKYFKEKERFELIQLIHENSWEEMLEPYIKEYEEAYDLSLENSFDICSDTVKKYKKAYTPKLKLKGIEISFKNGLKDIEQVKEGEFIYYKIKVRREND